MLEQWKEELEVRFGLTFEILDRDYIQRVRQGQEVVATLDAYQDWKIPADRFGNIDEFGAICALFCSAHAGYIVGQSLVVDGGVTNSTF